MSDYERRLRSFSSSIQNQQEACCFWKSVLRVGCTAKYSQRMISLWPILIVLLGALTLGCNEYDHKTRELYRQGNLLYEKGKYAEAGRVYNRIIENGIRNGNVYYNLGNSHYKQDQIGAAILAYEKALRLLPRDEDVRNNLKIANKRSIDQINFELSWFEGIILDIVTMNETLLIMTITGFMATLSLVFYILTPNRSIAIRARYLLLITGIIFFIAVGFTLIKLYDHLIYNEGIILRKTAVIRTSPNNDSEAAFTLHEGAKVRLVENRDAWTKIQLPDRKNGWIMKKEIEEI
tara:strand:- start:95777 stop:96652 length:876 start_codon:yes stop_codon:yes gene_type:complete